MVIIFVFPFLDTLLLVWYLLSSYVLLDHSHFLFAGSSAET